MIMLENSDAHKKHQDKMVEEMGSRLRQMEQLLETRQAEINNYQVKRGLGFGRWNSHWAVGGNQQR